MFAALPSSVPPTIVLAVSGSIAAYKAVEVARLLKKAGARVIPLLTRSAREFVGAQTLAGITGEPVHEEMFDPGYPGEKHVELGRTADLVLIVPATADLIARMAAGRADDLLTALVLCAQGPVLAAPAMHPRMWGHPATQRNVATLAADGRVSLIGPVEGEVASGERGMGRMADPAEIAHAALAAVETRDLAGIRIVVTAGPTVEDLDPVRFLGNRSTGKMGFAVAERAASRGASVTLVAGPVALATPRGVTRVDVRGALAMKEALWEAMGPDLGRADALIMSAAVADYRPAEQSATKRKRSAEALEIKLIPNPDLLAEVGAARTGARPVLVGFAVETADDAGIVAYARGKLQAKRVDMVVANHAQDSFGREDNRATIVTANGAEALGVMSKRDLADRILDRVAQRCR
ncbi:bifunctional phosphopantothenoylcysteine decarboxylase/phosphopantothenate--cysteine ligase CoaBC [Polyangium sp. 15x6]|uniref:bifunctional phosphopantothenoylcysteine decarboxylase/phosphopantothenate--cysteine ligase CoaBC n=1 Tax=Polyangium sp. 15x6 TaxID=3042687 RepID=UPI00249C4A79|nr:bifunctional phosphopantothenoylcysteine decarboxylase/phosphopantothenate--cysteine ligase CoaBC [Polyangium sp. 15x6]MDI3286463.1 bifunctional phosphopantothenoylcysteine decarboxylase/phosphopantothenate--cysteine ligase CoaBC [Polyangium sp. 15x6]